MRGKSDANNIRIPSKQTSGFVQYTMETNKKKRKELSSLKKFAGTRTKKLIKSNKYIISKRQCIYFYFASTKRNERIYKTDEKKKKQTTTILLCRMHTYTQKPEQNEKKK